MEEHSPDERITVLEQRIEHLEATVARLDDLVLALTIEVREHVIKPQNVAALAQRERREVARATNAVAQEQANAPDSDALLEGFSE